MEAFVLLLFVLAVVLFALAAFIPKVGRASLTPLGLVALTAALALSHGAV